MENPFGTDDTDLNSMQHLHTLEVAGDTAAGYLTYATGRLLMTRPAALHHTALHCITWHCTAPHCTTPHCTASHGTAPHRTASHRTAQHRTVLHPTPPHVTSRHNTPGHARPRHVIVTSRHDTPRHDPIRGPMRALARSASFREVVASRAWQHSETYREGNRQAAPARRAPSASGDLRSANRISQWPARV